LTSETPKLSRVQELVYELKVGDAMCSDPVTATRDTSMSEFGEMLRSHRISGVPVLDGKKVVGVISIEDLIKWLSEGSKDASVGDRMSSAVSVLYDDDPLTQAIERTEKTGFGRFPVCDRATGELRGVITKGDIMATLLRQLEVDYHEEEIRSYRASHIFEDIVADKVSLTFYSRVRDGDFDRAGEASSGLRKTLMRLGVRPDIVRRAAIASYEAEMNLVIYGGGGKITCRVEADHLCIDVRDAGPGIPDIDKAMVPGYSTAPEWVRELGFGAGMGLVNIKKCADKMQIKSEPGKGTHLRIAISMKAA
jgi:CBS domain-containing protein/anti-sigma regulatory factor (Ser/Thr protein kinase)